VTRRWAIGFLVMAGVAAPPARAEPAPVSIVVKGGRPVDGPQVVKLKRDDAVVLQVLSDTADEVHVHGYNLKVALKPNVAATLKFAARRTGRFTIELHKSGAEIGVLEIYPK
jgi:hypothetical protein